MHTSRFEAVEATDLKPGDTISRHGYLWDVVEVVYDQIGNGTADKPAPRYLVRVKQWAGYEVHASLTEPVSLGGIVGTKWHRLKLFKKRQRVQAVVWGETQQGTIEQDNGGSVVFVLWDGAFRPAWMFAESLTAVE